MLDGDERWRALPAPTGERFTWDRRLDLHPQAAVPRRRRAGPGSADRHRGRARARAARRQRHHRPHLAGGRDPPRRSGRRKWLLEHGVPVARLQLVRRAARQPRGDGARHVRATSGCATSSRPGTEGGVTVHLPDGEPMTIYDASMRYAGRRRAARRARGQGVRLGQLARLGREGLAAARRARRDRGVVRAHPPFEPRRDGRAAAAVRGRASRSRRSGSPATRSSRSPGSPPSPTTVRCPAGFVSRRTAPSSRRSPGSTRRSSARCSSRAGSCRTPCAGSPMRPRRADAAGRPRCVS